MENKTEIAQGEQRKMSPRYDYAIFDFDGTLIDTSEGIVKSLVHILSKEFSINETDQQKLNRFIGPPLAATFEAEYGFKGEQLEKAMETYRAHYTKTGLYQSKMFPLLKQTLETLRDNNVKIGIASSKPAYLIHTLLEYFGLEEMFDTVVGVKGGMTQSHTKSECIEIALDHLGCKDKSRAVMVGDRCFDAVGAKDSNIDFIAAEYGGSAPLSEFLEFEVKLFAKSLTEVADFICT